MFNYKKYVYGKIKYNVNRYSYISLYDTFNNITFLKQK